MWFKTKAIELALAFTTTMAVLQILTPMFVDVMFDLIIIGAWAVVSKMTK